MTLLPNDHSIAVCWNPHHHGDPFKPESAEIFRAWYLETYPHCGAPPDRFAAAPLCAFSGSVHSPYTCTERSLGGTYAVCPACAKAMMCGYGEKGLEPRRCACGCVLKFNDYFQPALTGIKASPSEQRALVDPAKDPAVPAAEVCALRQAGVPYGRLAGAILILTAARLIRTGGQIDPKGYVVSFPVLFHRGIEDVFMRDRWLGIDPRPQTSPAVLTKAGRIMLAARKIASDPSAASWLEDLLALDDERFHRQAALALGTLLNAPND